MRKVWSTLVILAILVGMFVCLGAQASAEEGPKDLAVVAVGNETLTAEHIERIKESMPGADVLVIDVNGVDGDGAGYSYGYSDMDQGFAPDNYSFIWPGMASVPTMEVTDNGDNHCKVVLLPIGPNDTVDSINAAVDGYKAEGGNVVVVAVAPASCYNVQAAVDSNVDQVLTCGETDAFGDKLIRVGEDETNPVCVITVDEFGSVNPTTMPLPEATDPGVGTQGTMTLDEPGPGTNEISSDPTTYTVTFAGGGAAGEMAAVTVEAGQVYELPQYCDFSYDGYTFTGWQIGEVTYQVFDPVEWTYTTQTVTVNSDITATALWQEQKTQYSVSYMPGTADGVEITGYMPPSTMDEGTSYTLQGCAFAASGYEFKGWDIDGVTYQPNETITVNGYITATAIWEKSSAPVDSTVSDKYTITFKAGVDGLNDITTPDKVVGDTIVLADLTTDDFFNAGGALPPEDKTFKGWKQTAGEGMSDEIKAAGTEVTVTGAMEFTAQWDTVTVPVAPGAQELTVSYKYNEETITDEMKYLAESTVQLRVFAECGFTAAAPEGQRFKAWKLGENEYAEGTEYTLGAESVTFEAVFEPIPAESFTVTFDVNGGTGAIASMQAAPNGVITLPGGSALTAPANKGFAGWKIGEQTYQANAQYTVTADVTAYAQWSDLQSAGHVDTLTWTQGGTDALVVTYSAPIATISMDGVQLTAGSHYQLSNNNMTAQFYNDYLNGLAAGNHTIVFTFGAAPQNGVAPAATYANETVTLTIAAPASQPATASLEYTWADRNQPLVITMQNETPVALQIDYGSNGGYKTPQGNTNYSVSGNTLTLKPDLVNKNNGGVWPAGRYGFKVITSSGSNPNLQVTLTSNTVNNTSNTTTGGTSPVTGDTNNVVLYVVLLAVLVAALVVVLVVLVKRRNSGRR